MKYAFIAAHAGEFGVERMCRVLGVGRSGYYAWHERPASLREKENLALLEKIQVVFSHSRKTYGSPRIHAALQRQGIPCGRHRVARLMRSARLAARIKRKGYPLTTQRQAGATPAGNLLNREFSATAPNQKWVTDITYLRTGEGWLYLASILDLFSRRVVGWALAEELNAPLVEAALAMALANRQPAAGLLHHSDQGRQYTSLAYQLQLLAHHCQVSMSRTGNCYDNAVMESFFSTLKQECAFQPFRSRAQARKEVAEYIEAWYNRQRLHSSLGYRSPDEFEQQLGN